MKVKYVGGKPRKLIYRGEQYMMKPNQTVELPLFPKHKHFVHQVETGEEKAIKELKKTVEELKTRMVTLEKVAAK